MLQNTICKAVFRRISNVLGQKNGGIIGAISCFLLLISAFQFGEVWLKWSRDKYQRLFSFYSDNISHRSYQEKLCQYVPIDIVYTWVNGSDPTLIEELNNLSPEYGGKTEALSCSCRQCWPSPYVFISPALPSYFSKWDLKDEISGLDGLADVIFEESSNGTLFYFDAVEKANIFLDTSRQFSLGKSTFKARPCHFNDSGSGLQSILLKDSLFFSGLTVKDKSHLLSVLPSKISDVIIHVDIHPHRNQAAVKFMPGYSSVMIGHQLRHIKTAKLYLVHQSCQSSMMNSDSGPNRFQDNDELKYSLRSVERHAPWVHHIYLVTNGQIPYWLNLDHPHLTVVTHEEIFEDPSILPTFSSPAIEAQLHRIPRLSNKFLYMNDDVFFGRAVWPDDFYSPITGQKVYLSWPVPECQEGCPDSWIHDGYCDKSCNNSVCMWDGGDCLLDSRRPSEEDVLYDKMEEELNCAPSCSGSWLADKYCDSSCNVYSCGFDAGDCGVSNFQLLDSTHFDPETKTYTIPNGSLSFFWNLTLILQREEQLSILEGTSVASPIIRAVALSRKYSLLILVLNPGYSTAVLELSLTFGDAYKSFTLLFNATANTLYPKLNPLLTLSASVDPEYVYKYNATNVGIKPIVFEIQNDIAWDGSDNMSSLSGVFVDEFRSLKRDLQLGYLTDSGFAWKKKVLKDIFKRYPDLTKEELRVEEHRLYSQFKVKPYSSSVRPVQSRQLRSYRFSQLPTLADHNGSFPWEKKDVFVSRSHHNRFQRRLLDTFGDSLRHVNNLFNSVYGYEARKVPAHMPHLIDKNIMQDLVERFKNEFIKTSLHKIRQSDDMQFAFSYFYYLLSEKKNFSLEAKFKEIDTDSSGTWSDREIRTLLTQIYDLPLYFNVVEDFEKMLMGCAGHSPAEQKSSVEPKLEVISWELVKNCSSVVDLLRRKFSHQKKFKYEIVSEDDVTFRMLSSNVSLTVGILDDIRKSPRKFIALNDNLDHNDEENHDTLVVKNLLVDFYESLFPIPSSFELPSEYRNRFLYIDELRAWMYYRDTLRTASYICIGSLIVFSVISFFHAEVINVYRKFRRRRIKSPYTTV